MKRIYQTAAEASLCCLLSCGVSALPVKPVRIVMHYGVPCLDCEQPLLEGEIGRIIQRADGRVQIVLDPSKPIPQKRFAVAHELGHYLLGHLDRPPEPDDECDADSFADGVLMPLCVLYGVQAVVMNYTLVNDDYNTDARAVLLAYNSTEYMVLAQLTIHDQPSDVSRELDSILNSIQFLAVDSE